MISDEADYAFVSTQFRWCSDAIRDAFNGYIRLIAAISGGSIYLSVQPGISSSEKLSSFALLSDVALALAALIAITQILENVRSRRGYRIKMSKLGGDWPDGTPKIPLPKRGAILIEIVMVLSILVSLVMFVALNPFQPVIRLDGIAWPIWPR